MPKVAKSKAQRRFFAIVLKNRRQGTPRPGDPTTKELPTHEVRAVAKTKETGLPQRKKSLSSILGGR